MFDTCNYIDGYQIYKLSEKKSMYFTNSLISEKFMHSYISEKGKIIEK